MGCCGGDDAAADARALEDQRNARIKEGTEKVNQIFSGFGKGFYDKRASDYVNFALPTLSQEARDTQRASNYSLANRGLLGGSAARLQNTNLAQEINRQKQGVFDMGTQQAQNLQKEVESNRSNIISQLQASSDPTSAQQSAINTAANFSAPSVWQPVNGFLNSWANLWLTNRAANQLNSSTQIYQNNTPSYGAPKASSYSVK